MAIKKLKSRDLRRKLPSKALSFKTTDDLKPLNAVIGQDRALKALQLGLEIEASGYNVFVTGMSGTGRTTIIKNILRDYARKNKVPPDWCYVYNFDDPDTSQALSLPAGKGKKFQRDMAQLIETLQREIKRVFSSEHYESQRTDIVQRINQEKRHLMQHLDEKALKLNLKVQPTSTGFQTIPLRDQQPMNQEMFDTLSEKEKKAIDENVRRMEEEISDTLRQLARLDIKVQKLLNQLNEDVGSFVVTQYVDDIKQEYRDFPQLLEYLEAVCRDIVSNVRLFWDEEEEPEKESLRETRPPQLEEFNRYRVNVVVDNSHLKGAPVIHETHPTYNNLFGRIEKYPVSGGYMTDFTKIKAGTLLKANGGYLMTDALEVLRNPFVYDTLKRSLRNRELRIEDASENYGTLSVVSLKPQPIPLKLKVILIGWQRIYHHLRHYDDDFSRVFKIRADFDYEAAAKNRIIRQYAQFVKRIIDDENLPPFERDAVEEIIRYGQRLADDQEKISLEFGQIIRIIQQAAFWANKEGDQLVKADHVRRAIRESEYRHSKFKDKRLEAIQRDIRKINVSGEVVGEINALSVYSVGEYAFGIPSRITAKTYIGSESLITIDRKVGFTGKIHDKGTYILAGFFNSKFGEYMSLSFSASLAFEQSYGRIDGDSASSTELYVLISSLAEVPINQGIAVTGSVNQNGEIQAIGGVNEKIEGFFEVCQLKGLNGEQGVLIPRSNVKGLVLKEEVAAAVEADNFHIWAIDTVEDGLKVLTGINPGKRTKSGRFSKDSLYQRVENKLRELAIRTEDYRKSISEIAKKRSEVDGKKKGKKKSPSKKPPQKKEPNGNNKQ